MDNTGTPSQTFNPFFHEASEAVRFWVATDTGRYVAASIRRDTLRYLFGSTDHRNEPLALFLAHQAEIHAAALRRLAAGSLEPILLREPDLGSPRR